MRRFATFLVALVLSFVAASSLGATASQGPSRIVLEAKLISYHETDKKPTGPSAGDRGVEKTRLLNAVPQFGKPAGAVVGHDSGTTVLDSKTRARITGVTHLPGGTLTVRGRMAPDRQRGGLVAPVTNGSGAFAGARGTLWIVRFSSPTRVLNVYTLKYGTS